MSSMPPKKKHSDAWKYFELVENNDKVARCKVCDRTYAKGGETSNLLDHLKRNHPRDLKCSETNSNETEKEQPTYSQNRTEKVQLDTFSVIYL